MSVKTDFSKPFGFTTTFIHKTPSQEAKLQKNVANYIKLQQEKEKIDQKITEANKTIESGRQQQIEADQRINEGRQKQALGQQKIDEGQKKIDEGQKKIDEAQQKMSVVLKRFTDESLKKKEQTLRGLPGGEAHLQTVKALLAEVAVLEERNAKGERVTADFQKLQPRVVALNTEIAKLKQSSV